MGSLVFKVDQKFKTKGIWASKGRKTYTKQKLASVIEEFEEAMDAPSEDAPDEL